MSMAPRGGDEINILTAGANYGWPLVSHGREYSGGPVGEGPRPSPAMLILSGFGCRPSRLPAWRFIKAICSQNLKAVSWSLPLNSAAFIMLNLKALKMGPACRCAKPHISSNLSAAFEMLNSTPTAASSSSATKPKAASIGSRSRGY